MLVATGLASAKRSSKLSTSSSSIVAQPFGAVAPTDAADPVELDLLLPLSLALVLVEMVLMFVGMSGMRTSPTYGSRRSPSSSPPRSGEGEK